MAKISAVRAQKPHSLAQSRVDGFYSKTLPIIPGFGDFATRTCSQASDFDGGICMEPRFNYVKAARGAYEALLGLEKYLHQSGLEEIGRAWCRESDWSSDVCSSDLILMEAYAWNRDLTM